MSLSIYDNLSQEKQPLAISSTSALRLYVCGNTVYDHCHMGHARSMLVFDSFTRFLRAQGLAVQYVRNITDIDDKIILRAKEQGISWQELSEQYIDAQHEDERALHMHAPDHEPRATAHIPGIIALIETLILKGHAYAVDGHVFYHVRSFASYGKLSHRCIDQLQTDASAVGLSKKDPLDFALWKAAKPGEPSWDAPWGAGRPGWHIECSAMCNHHLGPTIEIHGGGMDLKFPHHDNEIAQSEAAFEQPLAKIWMHIGLVTIEGQKMSKSLGNFVTIRQALKTHHPETIRYFMLASHYRSPSDYSQSRIKQSYDSLCRLYRALQCAPENAPTSNAYTTTFCAALMDDFNTPAALATLFEMASGVFSHQRSDPETAQQLASTLRTCAQKLGLLHEQPTQFLQHGLDADKIEVLIAQRQQARADKNWAQADALRAQLDAMGVTLEDSGQKTTWRCSQAHPEA